MKKCVKCSASLSPDDTFCRYCGTNQKDYGGEQPVANESRFLKYSAYLDDESLYKVAWAKEQNLVSSTSPNEAEEMYRALAMRNHLESAYRIAMINLNKQPPNLKEAVQWLKFAAERGHVPSINYLNTAFPGEYKPPRPVAPPHVPVAPYVAGGAAKTEGTMSGEDVFEKFQVSVVEIMGRSKKTSSCASGLVVSSTGFIITNAHAVLDKGYSVYEHIEVKRGNEVVNAMVVACGKPADGHGDSADLALLFAPELMNCGSADLSETHYPRNGQRVYLIGNSRGSGTCITSGIVSDARREMPGLSYPYIMTDAAANQGNSGGPLLSEDGKVIGILVSGIKDAEGMNFAIPIDVVKEFIVYVTRRAGFSPDALAEINTLNRAPTSMAIGSDKIFTGIHLLLDVIAFIAALF